VGVLSDCEYVLKNWLQIKRVKDVCDDVLTISHVDYVNERLDERVREQDDQSAQHESIWLGLQDADCDGEFVQVHEHCKDSRLGKEDVDSSKENFVLAIRPTDKSKSQARLGKAVGKGDDFGL